MEQEFEENIVEQDKNHINSIVRAIRLLYLFDEDTKELGITEISKRMDLHKSSVYRIVRTLEFMGWLEQDPQTEKYKPGVKILDVASTIIKSYDYNDVIFQGMRELKEQVRETIVLSVYTDLCGICIDQIEAENTITYSSKLGHKTPVHSGATGKILLAYLDEKEIERVIAHGLQRFTPNTITDPDELRAHLAEIRKNGYTVSFEETDPGVSAIGCPIFDKRRRVLYGISIVGPTERLKEKGVEELVELLKRKTAEINRKIQSIAF